MVIAFSKYKKYKNFFKILIVLTFLICIFIYTVSNVSIKQISIYINMLSFLFVIGVNIKRNSGMLNIMNPTVLYAFCFFCFFGVGFQFSDTSGVPFKNIYIISVCVILTSCVIVLSSLIDFSSNMKDVILPSLTELIKSKRFGNTVFVIAFIGYLVFIKKVHTLPIFLTDLEQSRVNSSLDVGGGLRIIIYLFILSGIISFQNFLYAKILKRVSISSLAIWILSILCLLSLGNRSPAFTIITISVMLFLFVNDKTKLNLKKILKIGVPVCFLIFLFVGGIGAYRVLKTPEMWKYKEYVNLISNHDYWGLMCFSFFHYFSIGVANFIDLVSVVPSIIHFQMGYTYLMPLITLLPGQQFTIDIILKNALGQTYLGGGTIPSFLGEAYINFNIFGAFIIPFLSLTFLIILKKIYIRKSSIGNQLIYIYIYFYLCYSQLAGIASTSLFPLVALITLILYKEYVS